MKIVRYNRLVIPILLIFIIACALPGNSPTITRTPTAGATETEKIPAHSPDAIFYNGIILSMDDNRPQAQAIAIDGERILAVGTNNEILTLKGSSTQVIDLRGKTVMPGFIDSHSHRLTQRIDGGSQHCRRQSRKLFHRDGRGWTNSQLNKANCKRLSLWMRKEGYVHTSMYI